MSKADLGKEPDEVAGMFDDVAKHYDRTNAVLSAGNAYLWRIATVRAVAPLPGEHSGLTHTAASRCSTASAHSLSMSAAVASAVSNVWSMTEPNRIESAKIGEYAITVRGTVGAWSPQAAVRHERR